MSLHSIARDGLAGRLRRRLVASRPISGPVALPARVSISSMRVLETGLALGAITTALLLGIGR